MIKLATGAGLGALAGLLWFAMSSILEALIVVLFHKGPELSGELVKALQQASSQTADPQVLALFDKLKTPSGLEFLMVLCLFLAFLASIVLGGLGGLLGGATLGRRDKT
jgi:hypothetical protein